MGKVSRTLACCGLAALALSSCDLLSETESGPPAPSGLTLTSGSGAIRASWTPVPTALSYRLYWSSTPGIDVTTAPSLPVQSPPYVQQGVFGLYYVRVTAVYDEGEGPPSEEKSVVVAAAGIEKYFPSWYDVAPTTVIPFDYDPTKSSAQNGADLAGMLQLLQPGDRLEIGSGTYSMDKRLDVSLQGTAQAPIWIVAQENAKPVITRPNNIENALNVGIRAPTRFLCFRGLEITGGDIGVFLYDCQDIWFDQCEVHQTPQTAIAANSHDTANLTFTRNEVHHTQGYAEGFYIGANNGVYVSSNCVIALNHVYECRGWQGDGIEVKQGSYGTWIAENVVHDTNYPCILVYGTNGKPRNVVEKNLCWNSLDNTMQVQGEAIVRNNVVLFGKLSFHSSDHQGQTRDLVVVHNTFVNVGLAANLESWSGRPGMVFSNNACYSRDSAAILLPGGPQGVQVAGNVAVGYVTGLTSGYTVGVGLSDFVDVSWKAERRDVTPSLSSALLGAADPSFAELEDKNCTLREAPYDSGAVEAP